VLEVQVMTVIDFLAAAIQMTQHGRKVDAGGVYKLFVGQVESRPNGEQFSAYRADLGVDLPCVHQGLDEVRQQQNVRVKCQHPLALRQGDGLVLSRREPHILVVVIDAAAVGELFQKIDRTVG